MSPHNLKILKKQISIFYIYTYIYIHFPKQFSGVFAFHVSLPDRTSSSRRGLALASDDNLDQLLLVAG